MFGAFTACRKKSRDQFRLFWRFWDGIAKACLHRGYEEAASGTEGEAVSGIVSGTAGSFVW